MKWYKASTEVKLTKAYPTCSVSFAERGSHALLPGWLTDVAAVVEVKPQVHKVKTARYDLSRQLATVYPFGELAHIVQDVDQALSREFVLRLSFVREARRTGTSLTMTEVRESSPETRMSLRSMACSAIGLTRKDSLGEDPVLLWNSLRRAPGHTT